MNIKKTKSLTHLARQSQKIQKHVEVHSNSISFQDWKSNQTYCHYHASNPTQPRQFFWGKLCIPGIFGYHHLAIFQGQTQTPLRRPTETSDTQGPEWKSQLDSKPTLPKTNRSPLKIGHPKRKRSYSNHPFSGAKMLVSGRVSVPPQQKNIQKTKTSKAGMLEIRLKT